MNLKRTERNFKKKFLSYCSLIRIDEPTGLLLLLWPTLWAIWIATSGFPSLKVISLFFFGALFMRSAGCVINDFIDRKFDGHVKRTALRPIPRGKITKKETSIVFSILVLLSFLLVLTLNKRTILFSAIALALTFIYPFMKRYIYFPQMILGITFSLSILIVFSAVDKHSSFNCWLLFIANVLWTIAYDTQYAMMDYKDDLKLGIKSTAILFRRREVLIIGILQTIFLSIMIVVGYISNLRWMFYCALLIGGMLFIYQQRLISMRNNTAYFRAFKNNNYVGLVISLGLIASYI